MEKEKLVCYSFTIDKRNSPKRAHIGFYNEGKPLCGRIHSDYDCVFPEITTEWIESGVNSNTLCLDCAKKAKLILKTLPKTKKAQ